MLVLFIGAIDLDVAFILSAALNFNLAFDVDVVFNTADNFNRDKPMSIILDK